MLVSSGTVSPTTDVAEADEAVLLEALAEAGDALTAALVAHDLAALTAATRAAEALCEQIDVAEARRESPQLTFAEHYAMAERIAATARRNATLLETAWLTDAAILRLLAAATIEHDDTSGPYQAPAASSAPAGWLDRTA